MSSCHGQMCWKSGRNLLPLSLYPHPACQTLQALAFLLTFCPYNKGKHRLSLELLPVPVSMTQHYLVQFTEQLPEFPLKIRVKRGGHCFFNAGTCASSEPLQPWDLIPRILKNLIFWGLGRGLLSSFYFSAWGMCWIMRSKSGLILTALGPQVW